MEEKFSKPRYMNIQQYADYIGVNPKTVHYWLGKEWIEKTEVPLPNGTYMKFIDRLQYPSGPPQGVKWNMQRKKLKNP